MKTSRVLWLFVVLSGASCLDVPPFADPEDLSSDIAWVSPAASLAYTNGTIRLEVTVAGAVDALEFYRGEVLLLRRTAGPFVHGWVTNGEAEGTYPISVRVFRGETQIMSSTRMITVDRTPPTLAALEPTDGATDVPRRGPFRASFSEPVSPDSLDAAGIRAAAGGEPVKGGVSLSDDGRTVVLMPAQPLITDRDYFFSIGSVRDLAGNVIAAETSGTVRVPSWLRVGSGVLSSLAGLTPAREPSLSVDSQGRPCVAWIESEGRTSRIYVQRWSGTDWIRLGGALGVGDRLADDKVFVSLSGADDPYVLWSDAAPGDEEFRARAVRWTGTGWVSLPAFPTPARFANRWINAVLPADGSGALVAYTSIPVSPLHRDCSTGLDCVERFAWHPLVRPDLWDATPAYVGIRGADGPKVTSVGKNGTGFLLALRLGDGAGNVYYEIRKNGGTLLGAPLRGAGVIREVAVGSGPDEAPWVSWTDGPFLSPDNDLHFARFDGSAWRDVGSTINDGLSLVSGPQMITTGAGELLIAFSALEGNTSNIHVWRWTGSNWVPHSSPLSAVPGNTNAASPKLALDMRGTPFIAWAESDSTSAGNIYVRRWNE